MSRAGAISLRPSRRAGGGSAGSRRAANCCVGARATMAKTKKAAKKKVSSTKPDPAAADAASTAAAPEGAADKPAGGSREERRARTAKKKAEAAATESSTVAASIGATATQDAAPTTALASVFADLPATVAVNVHEPKPAAKKSKRRKLSALASDTGSSSAKAGSPDSDEDSDTETGATSLASTAEDDGLNPGWKARMVAEKSAGITKVRDGRTPAEVRAERQGTAEARTIFVGNLPLTHAKKKPLRKLFISCGVIESVRFRSFTVSDLRLPKKAAFINSAFHEQRDSCNAYVVFKSTDEAVIEAALAKNNTVVEGHHIRVDRAARSSDARDGANKRSVFVGNLPFDVTEESLRAHFEDAGMEGIDNVRIVRDPKTGLGKGIAFVGFSTEDTAVAALSLHESEFAIAATDGKAKQKGRTLRIFRASAKLAAQAHKRGHTSDGHSGTVGNPSREFGRGGGRGEGRGRGRGGDRGRGRGGARGGGRGGRGGSGRGSDQGFSGVPAWQGQRSEVGYVPSEMASKRKKGGGGHAQQNKKPKRRHVIRM